MLSDACCVIMLLWCWCWAMPSVNSIASFAMIILQACVQRSVKEAAGLFETQQPTVGCWNQTLLEVACLDVVNQSMAFQLFPTLIHWPMQKCKTWQSCHTVYIANSRAVCGGSPEDHCQPQAWRHRQVLELWWRSHALLMHQALHWPDGQCYSGGGHQALLVTHKKVVFVINA